MILTDFKSAGGVVDHLVGSSILSLSRQSNFFNYFLISFQFVKIVFNYENIAISVVFNYPFFIL